MKAIRDAGGWTIGQDAESCTVYGMPRSAAEMNALSRVAPLYQIASEINAAFRCDPVQLRLLLRVATCVKGHQIFGISR